MKKSTLTLPKKAPGQPQPLPVRVAKPAAAIAAPAQKVYEPNQIMLDLETLDTAPTAIVLSIGLCRFDPAAEGDGIKDQHYVVLSVGDQEENERTVSESTMAWWEEQSDAAKVVLAQAAEAEHDVHEKLLRVAEWMGTNPVLWGNGSDFDNVILASLFNTYEFSRLPWSFRRNRCFRTLCAMAWQRSIPFQTAREGTHHNALDDAVYQANIAVKILRAL